MGKYYLTVIAGFFGCVFAYECFAAHIPTEKPPADCSGQVYDS